MVLRFCFGGEAARDRASPRAGEHIRGKNSLVPAIPASQPGYYKDGGARCPASFFSEYCMIPGEGRWLVDITWNS